MNDAEHGGIWIMPASGGAPRQLTGRSPTEDDYYPQWFPDGRQLAILRDVPGSESDVWLVTLDGTLRRLTTHPAFDGKSTISPDGRWIAFPSERSGARNLWIMPVAEGESAARQFTFDGGRGPAWSPDGQWVVAPQERIETLDIVRGFALLGILLCNWSVDLLWDPRPWAGFGGTADQVAWWAVRFLLDEKFWPIFAFLFGLGFSIQMQRAEARGAPFVAIYARRLAVLFLIGAAHYILTETDTVFQYALLGFLLLPLRKLNLNLLVVLAVLCVLVPFTRWAFMAHDRLARATHSLNARTEITLDPTVLDTYVGEYELASGRAMFVFREGNTLLGQLDGLPRLPLFPESPTEFFMRARDMQVSFKTDSARTVTGLVQREEGKSVAGRVVQRGQPVVDDRALREAAIRQPVDRIYAHGTFRDIVTHRARQFWEEFSSWTNYVGWLDDPFPPFLLGLYAGRRRIFHEVAKHRQFLRRVMWWGLVLGLAATTPNHVWRILLHPGETILPFALAAVTRLSWVLGSPALGMAYIAALTLLLQREGWKRRLGPMGAVGRMALTNYLLQSVAFVLLFYSYGLGWYGKVGAFGGFMLCLPVFALQIVASKWWLNRFRFGPAEWLWRTLTYGKLQPMRIQVAASKVY